MKFKVRVIETQEVVKECVVNVPKGLFQFAMDKSAAQLYWAKVGAVDGQDCTEHYVTHLGVTSRRVEGVPQLIEEPASNA